MSSMNKYVRLSWFVGSQIIYTIVIVLLRPLKDGKDNTIEIINELFYSGLWLTLIFWNSEDHWSKKGAWLYIGAMISNSSINALISICRFYLKSSFI